MKKPFFKRLTTIVLVLIFLPLFLYFLPLPWFEHLWFESDVWGTVSDWAMVIVTFITAVLLFKTLSAQVEINDFVRIEHFSNHAPQFNFFFFNYKDKYYHVDIERNYFNFTLYMTLNGNNCSVQSIKAHVTPILLGSDIKIEYPKFKEKIHLDQLRISGIDKAFTEGSEPFIYVELKYVYKNKYLFRQRISIKFHDKFKKHEILNGKPKYVEDI